MLIYSLFKSNSVVVVAVVVNRRQTRQPPPPPSRENENSHSSYSNNEFSQFSFSRSSSLDRNIHGSQINTIRLYVARLGSLGERFTTITLNIYIYIETKVGERERGRGRSDFGRVHYLEIARRYFGYRRRVSLCRMKHDRAPAIVGYRRQGNGTTGEQASQFATLLPLPPPAFPSARNPPPSTRTLLARPPLPPPLPTSR